MPEFREIALPEVTLQLETVGEPCRKNQAIQTDLGPPSRHVRIARVALPGQPAQRQRTQRKERLASACRPVSLASADHSPFCKE